MTVEWDELDIEEQRAVWDAVEGWTLPPEAMPTMTRSMAGQRAILNVRARRLGAEVRRIVEAALVPMVRRTNDALRRAWDRGAPR